MLGVATFVIGMILLFGELISLYWQNIHQREIMAAVSPEIEIHWIRRPDNFRRIEADWERILRETELCRKSRKK